MLKSWGLNSYACPLKAFLGCWARGGNSESWKEQVWKKLHCPWWRHIFLLLTAASGQTGFSENAGTYETCLTEMTMRETQTAAGANLKNLLSFPSPGPRKRDWGMIASPSHICCSRSLELFHNQFQSRHLGPVFHSSPWPAFPDTFAYIKPAIQMHYLKCFLSLCSRDKSTDFIQGKNDIQLL